MTEAPVAAVTGAAGGIGLPLAAALVRAGYRVAAIDRVAPSGLDALHVAVDLLSPDGPGQAVDATVAAFGRIDLLVNGAGLFSTATTMEVECEEWDRVMAINLRAPFLASKAAARHMISRGAGAIVNISSVAGFYPRADQAAYGASKAGLEHLTRILALDLAPSGVRVNCVRPGVVETGMARASYGEAGLARWASAVPLRQLASPEDIAEAVLYLARARHVTGHVLCVDGGQVLNVVKA